MALKPGIRTTEFWASVLAIVGQILAALTGRLSGDAAVWGAALVAGIYAVSRALLKAKMDVETIAHEGDTREGQDAVDRIVGRR